MTEESKIHLKRNFAVISSESIQAFAEAAGHSNLPDDLASLISEDVVYRLREIIQSSYQYARHAKRVKLTAEDFNKALRASDTPAVLGHGAPESVKWRQTKDGELHFVDDGDVNLANVACTEQAPHQPGRTTLRVHWAAVEGHQKSSLHPQSTTPSSTDTDVSSSSSRSVAPALLEYYDTVTRAILEGGQDVRQAALADLGVNSRITPIMPHLVSFISNGVRKLSQDARQLGKLLATIRALLSNDALFLQPSPYMRLLVESVLVCLLEPLPVIPPSDHWLLRDRAAALLNYIIQQWGSAINKLREQVIARLRSVLYNQTKPFSSQYGAISGLLALGLKTFEEVVYSHLASYWPHLQAALDDPRSTTHKQDAAKVHALLMLGAELLILSQRKSLLASISDNPPKDPQPGTLSLLRPDPSRGSPYPLAYELFGDSLSARLPVCDVNIYQPKPQVLEVCLQDADSSKSGEELLQQFLDVPGARGNRRGLADEFDLCSYAPSPDEDKSEHSSDHSAFSFLGDDQSDLTVKATLTDPTKGIKLFIAKKTKSKTSEAEDSEPSECDPMGSRMDLTRVKPARIRPAYDEVFERSVVTTPQTNFVFRFAGRVQRCLSTERRKSTVLDSEPSSPDNRTDALLDPMPDITEDSRSERSMHSGLLYGKRPQSKSQAQVKQRLSSNVDCFL